MGRNSWIYTLVELGIIPMNSTGFVPILSSIPCPVDLGVNPVEFIGMMPNLSSISCPVEFDRARNTAQNELKFMDLHPGRTGYHPNEFTPNFSNISCPVEFDRARNTA